MKTIKTVIVSALLLSGFVRAGEKPSLEPWELSEKKRIAQARKDAEKRARSGLPFGSALK